MGRIDAQHRSAVLNHGELHAQADAEERDFVFPGISDCPYFTFGTTLAEAAGHQDAVAALKQFGRITFLEFFGAEVPEQNFGLIGDTAMNKGFMKAFIGFGQIHIFSGNGDGDRVFGVFQVVNQLFPRIDVGLPGPDVEQFQDFSVQTFLVEVERHLINGIHVNGGDYRVHGNVAEQGDLFFEFLGERHFGSAHQNIGLDAVGPQLLDRVLGGFGFDLAGRFDIGYQGQVNEQRIFFTEVAAQLPDCLNEGQSLDIADGAANLDDGNVDTAVELQHSGFYFIGDMGNHLDGSTQIFAPPFLCYD